MAIWEINGDALEQVHETTFGAEGVLERADLQRLLRTHVDAIAPDVLVIAEEYADWVDSRRRIDLLAIDRDARFVVIELKRTDDGGHMDLQSLRYAAMVSKLTFRKVVEVFAEHLESTAQDAEERLIEFLGWDAPRNEEFGTDVRIVLASADFSKEITTTVLWLNERDIDIRCVRLKPYRVADRLVLDIQQIIPLPEASEYTVQVREKAEEVREAREEERDARKYDLAIAGRVVPALTKRGLIYEIVKSAIASGIECETIAGVFPATRERLISVPGELPTAEFASALKRMQTPRGRRYDARRYFCGDDELFRVRGRTYAFSNQWGGAHWAAAIRSLADAFPQLSISYRPTEGSAASLAD